MLLDGQNQVSYHPDINSVIFSFTGATIISGNFFDVSIDGGSHMAAKKMKFHQTVPQVRHLLLPTSILVRPFIIHQEYRP